MASLQFVLRVGQTSSISNGIPIGKNCYSLGRNLQSSSSGETASHQQSQLQHRKKQLTKLTRQLKMLHQDHNFPEGLETNPQRIYVREKYLQTRSLVPGLGSSALKSKAGGLKVKEFYQQAVKDWMAIETGEKEFYRKKAGRNKETIKTWYRMHENSKLLDQLSEIQKDIASIK